MRKRRASPALIALREANALRRWGCSHEQYRALRGKPMRVFQAHRSNARGRGIGFEFNLWQWWTIWQDSGRWDQRGFRGGDGYVMCRYGDVGPYAFGNIYIATSRQNTQDYWSNRTARLSAEVRT